MVAVHWAVSVVLHCRFLDLVFRSQRSAPERRRPERRPKEVDLAKKACCANCVMRLDWTHNTVQFHKERRKLISEGSSLQWLSLHVSVGMHLQNGPLRIE